MSDTTYVDYVAPAVNAEWLNEINDHVWHDTPVTGTTIHSATKIAVTPFDDIVATDVQAALNEINDKILPTDPIDASEVSYTADGTGAVTTTVQSKLRETVSVKDFGAVGDGVTNDLAAIQAALTTMTTGGTLFFPKGTYLISGSLADTDGIRVNKSNVSLIGECGTILQQDSTSKFVLVLDGTTAAITNIDITGIKFSGPTSRHVMTSGSDVYQHRHLLMAINVSNVNINNNHFYAFQGDGISLDMAFVGEGAPPYSNTRHNDDIWITNNLFDGYDNNNRNGISVIDGNNVFITNNKFKTIANQYMPGSIDIETNPYAYYIIRNIFINDNEFINTLGMNGHISFVIPTSGSYLPTAHPNNILISGNSMTGTGRGMYIQCAGDIPLDLKITDNTYYGTSEAIKVGYNSSFSTYLNQCVVSGNIFDGSAGANPIFGVKSGSIIDHIKDFIFTDNVVKGAATSSGTYFSGYIENAVIAHNVFDTALDYGMYFGLGGQTLVKNVSITGNVICNIAGIEYSIYSSSSTNSDASTCTWMHNTFTRSTLASTPADFVRFPAGKMIDYNSASPTTGYYAVGAIVYHSVPAVGSPKGWRCTVAGAPGTWVSEGNL